MLVRGLVIVLVRGLVIVGVSDSVSDSVNFVNEKYDENCLSTTFFP